MGKFDRAINFGYNKYVNNDIDAFIIDFEHNIKSQLFQEINPPNSQWIETVFINNLKLIELDINNNIGSLLSIYSADTTTTDNNIEYTFESEAIYWILLVLFLFIGCCFGCICWYIFCIKMDIISIILTKIDKAQKMREDDVRRQQQNKYGNKKKSEKETKKTKKSKTTKVAIEMDSKEKNKKNKHKKT